MTNKCKRRTSILWFGYDIVIKMWQNSTYSNGIATSKKKLFEINKV